MRFYIASAWKTPGRARRLAAALTAAGWEQTYDWTAHGLEESVVQLAIVAWKEFQGVSDADILIVLLPGGHGTHVELGMALAMGKPAVVHSEDDMPFRPGATACPFYWFKTVTRVEMPVGGLAAWLLDRYGHGRRERKEDGVDAG